MKTMTEDEFEALVEEAWAKYNRVSLPYSFETFFQDFSNMKRLEKRMGKGLPQGVVSLAAERKRGANEDRTNPPLSSEAG